MLRACFSICIFKKYAYDLSAGCFPWCVQPGSRAAPPVGPAVPCLHSEFQGKSVNFRQPRSCFRLTQCFWLLANIYIQETTPSCVRSSEDLEFSSVLRREPTGCMTRMDCPRQAIKGHVEKCEKGRVAERTTVRRGQVARVGSGLHRPC